MGSTPAFISELQQAANEVHQLTDEEKRRLFDRAARTIEEMRGVIEASGKVVIAGQPRRVMPDLRALARSVDSVPEVLIAHWLYVAAEAIDQLQAIAQGS